MLARFLSATLVGVTAELVSVEVDVSFGLPSFTLVGLPDSMVRESRDRVRSAIRNSGFEFPSHRVTVNLAPASVPKRGTACDLAIALGILAATGGLPERVHDTRLVVGELSLTGELRAVRGLLPIAVLARRRALRLLAPDAGVGEAAALPDLTVTAATSLVQAAAVLAGTDPGASVPDPPAAAPAVEADLSEVRGQAVPRRALEIAAAGRHNLLLVGPPGAGKSMLARRLPGLLPPLSLDESVETTAVHSVAGVGGDHGALIRRPPFRAPHHTASEVALVGGGPDPRPGEVSLAHHGVLFLDELPEFPRAALESLRQPLEEGLVRISRASRMAVFPAVFVLIGAMNPCPCGYHGHPGRPCRCPPPLVERYRQRVSGPLRDRIDLVVPVSPVRPDELLGHRPSEPTSIVQGRVAAARRRQHRRRHRAGAGVNGRLTLAGLDAVCPLAGPARELCRQALDRGALSARGYTRVRRVARTIADLAEADDVAETHVAEALAFRE